ncbi:MAG: FAD-dependent monooxygenase [Bacteroidetes bacterium]|jgi:flavin-dependent dehydrogenase|nr:FAD-dependent monooxygenase [Bacteroidota bacterium]
MSYEVGIVGGGMAGLAAANLLASQGHSVVVFEKGHYPAHKVCGEYLSNESLPFLGKLGLDIESLGGQHIGRFAITHPSGKKLETPLPLGGYGISRYALDDAMANAALAKGAIVLQGVRAQSILHRPMTDDFEIQTDCGPFQFKSVVAAYGKRSKLDKPRGFATSTPDRKNNFVGIKYHLRSDIPDDLIELHLFEQGYAGISRVENGRTCFCYLTTAQMLQKAGSISQLEHRYLARNPYLAHHLSHSEHLYSHPLSISQVSFGDKGTVWQHSLMAGDSAGMITPLTGNGMSMALHGAQLAAYHLDRYLRGLTDRTRMETHHARDWRAAFGLRVQTARRLQGLLLNTHLSSLAISILRPLPGVARRLIRLTHGKPF